MKVRLSGLTLVLFSLSTALVGAVTQVSPEARYLTESRLSQAATTAVVTVQPPQQDEEWFLGYDPSKYSGIVGSKGKNVVYLPTSPAVAYEMLKLANVGPNDVVYDLGSGDGRIPIMAAKHFGARAVGIELNPDLIRAATDNAKVAGVSDRVRFVAEDFFKADLSPATVITMFLLGSINSELRPTLQALKPGTRIVSNTFAIEGWQPDKSIVVSGCASFCRPHLWIVAPR